MIKVLTPKMGLDGCTWYRTRQPLKIAEGKDLLSVKELDPTTQSTKEIADLLKQADIYYLRFSFGGAANFIKEIRILYPHKPIVFDIDDDYFDVNPLNNFYGDLGTKEVMADGKPLWVEGKWFDPYTNRKKMIDYEYCLSHATVVTVTTDKLAETVSKWNDNVVVIPNAIDMSKFPKLDINKGDEQRLLWHGGSSHYPDLITVKDDLERLMKDFPKLHLYIYGQIYESLFKNIDKKRVHFEGWIGAEGHGYRLATVGADVAICPLADNPFNTNKSSVKYYENAALGIATVCKNMLPYAADIKHEFNGILYTKSLYKQVKTLLKNDEYRKAISEKGYEYVKKFRNIETVAVDFAELLKKLVDSSKEFKSTDGANISKVSIVIPIHNRINLTKQCINSLIKNTDKDKYELIVVDDDSTDGSREWLREQNLEHLIETNVHSCGAAKNIGMKHATYNTVYISDGDMYFQEGWLEELLDVYSKLPPIILGSLGHQYWKTIQEYDQDGKAIYITEQQPGYSWMINKSIWYQCGPLLEGVAPGVDDTEFCNKAKANNIFVGHLGSDKVLHCGIKRADGSITYGAEFIKNYPKGVITE